MAKQANEIWRDYDVDGVPSSGAHLPIRSEIRDWADVIETHLSMTGRAVLGIGTTTPPATPAVEDRYIVGAGAIGAWLGHDNNIAMWSGDEWVFLPPYEGLTAWDSSADLLYIWIGTSWAPQSGAGATPHTHDDIYTRSSAIPARDSVTSRIVSAPPATPTVNDRYIVAAGSTGSWLGHDSEIATWDGTDWTFEVPANGWSTWVTGESLRVDWDGSGWLEISGSSTSASLADIDEPVLGFAKTNGHGGGRWRAHWTKNYIGIAGDAAALGYDPAGDNSLLHRAPWDAATNGEIVDMVTGTNYLLIISDKATGNLFQMGATDDGQGGNGATTGNVLLPTQIATFAADNVHVEKIITEANVGNVEKFWFAITSAAEVYGCGYSGTQHVMGYNNSANLSTPRKLTYSDGVTPVTGVAAISSCTVHAPIWALLSDGRAVRWGAGTDGAHGNNDTVAMPWPEALETTPGSGVDRTDIAEIAVAGAAVSVTHAVTWLLTTPGKIEVAGAHDYGNGDGSAFGATDAVTFQPVAGIIDTLAVTGIFAGGGSTPNCTAITDAGDGYIVGYMAAGLRGDGLAVSLNVFSPLAQLPAGFAGALTDCVSAGGYNGSARQVIYLEATILGERRIAACGYDSFYQTAHGTTGVTVADRRYLEIVGSFGEISAWQSVGDVQVFGLEMLSNNGQLFYAGGNDQGQGGIGHNHSVVYMQPCAGGARIAEPLTPRGGLTGQRLEKSTSADYDFDFGFGARTTERALKDVSGIFTEVSFKRLDGTLETQSILTGTTPAYATRTVTHYDVDGVSVVETDSYILTYNGDNELVGEVLQ